MEKLEYSETQKILYKSMRKEPFFVDVPLMNYITFDGVGHPSGQDFQTACEALYTIAYIVKFEIARKRKNTDFKVNPMEVTWFLDKSGTNTAFTWTMMLMQPEFITPADVEEAMRIARTKGKDIAYDRIQFAPVEFGRSIQCFHAGDYNLMNDTLAKMKAFAEQNGVSCDAYTHDIYLNDMRKTKMENYKTIMRVRAYRQ